MPVALSGECLSPLCALLKVQMFILSLRSNFIPLTTFFQQSAHFLLCVAFPPAFVTTTKCDFALLLFIGICFIARARRRLDLFVVRCPLLPRVLVAWLGLDCRLFCWLYWLQSWSARHYFPLNDEITPCNTSCPDLSVTLRPFAALAITIFRVFISHTLFCVFAGL